MPLVTFVQANGEERQISANAGDSVMQAALNASLPGIIAECGGSAVCATCHVYVDAAWSARLRAPSRDEADMLDCAVGTDARSRLSCQIQLTEALDGLVVHVPQSQL